MPQAAPLSIVFALFPGVTHLDFTGPHQILCRLPGARVVAASLEGGEIEADGLTFAHLPRLADLETCDLLCVPGGFGTTEAMADPAFYQNQRKAAEVTREQQKLQSLVADHERHAGLRDGPRDGVALCQRWRHRLFEQDVFAGSERL